MAVNKDTGLTDKFTKVHLNFNKMNQRQRDLTQIWALKELGRYLFMWGPLPDGLIDNPYLNGEKPYEKDIIFGLIHLIYIKNIDPIAFECYSILLDWYCPDWKLFVSDEIVGKTIERSDKEVRNWKKDCLVRDNNKCTLCESDNNLQVHHIAEWAKHPSLRVSLDNGITLCGNCHHSMHPEMSKQMFIC